MTLKDNPLFEKYEKQGYQNILKYFDRLHDKLFTFNNILIGGYFVLSQIDHSIDIKQVLWPISNLVVFIYIEYRMYFLSKTQAKISKGPEVASKFFKKTTVVTVLSLLSVLSTAIVTGVFLFFLLG